MLLEGLIYQGPELASIDGEETVPSRYLALLRQINGFVAYQGGLHLRGICDSPSWHSLMDAWQGEHALHRLFPALLPSDLPFAQDCFGDQFVLREGIIHRLSGETGELQTMGLDWKGFFDALAADPVEFLLLQPFQRFLADGHMLQPGHLLSVSPPFVLKESEKGVNFRAIPMEDRMLFLADFARQLASVKDGETIEFGMKH